MSSTFIILSNSAESTFSAFDGLWEIFISGEIVFPSLNLTSTAQFSSCFPSAVIHRETGERSICLRVFSPELNFSLYLSTVCRFLQSKSQAKLKCASESGSKRPSSVNFLSHSNSNVSFCGASLPVPVRRYSIVHLPSFAPSIFVYA